jgi:hypothetical protein
MACQRSRRHLRRHAPAPRRQHGHCRSHCCPVKPLAESFHGATDRIPTPRVLDHVINQWHLRFVLARYVSYYHRARTHLSLEKDAPAPRRIHGPTEGRIVALAKSVAYIIGTSAALLDATGRVPRGGNRLEQATSLPAHEQGTLPQLVSENEFLPALGGGPPSPNRPRILLANDNAWQGGERARAALQSPKCQEMTRWRNVELATGVFLKSL